MMKNFGIFPNSRGYTLFFAFLEKTHFVGLEGIPGRGAEERGY